MIFITSAKKTGNDIENGRLNISANIIVKNIGNLREMNRFKYFTDQELSGMVDDICYKLDRARELFGHPIVITSGYRTFEQNFSIGGARNSAHLEGKAADIKAPIDAFQREKLMWAFGAAGFKRVESAYRHIHVDIANDDLHPSPYFWQGDDK